MNWKNPVSLDRQGREDITEFMIVCFDSLDTYGKNRQQLKNAIKLFLITLADYPAILIRKAFEKWVRTESKMPTPKDIISLMEEDNSQLLSMINRARRCYHYPNLGLAPEAHEYLQEKLGHEWRQYV
jgi:hypothetical protein